jgi:hypothetical protein
VDRQLRRRIEGRARSQHGVITRAQLLGLGLSSNQVLAMTRRGDLITLHRGVYRLGIVEAPLARQMAAVLACGPGAALGGLHAAARWRLLPDPPPSLPIDLIVAGADTGVRPGIRRFRTRRPLPPDERTILERIPITTIARTVLDLAGLHAAGRLPERDLEQGLAAAHQRDRHLRGHLISLIARYPTRRGTAALRRLLTASGSPAFTRSEAEARALALFRSAGLPRPEVNAAPHGASGRRYELDFLWRQARLAVEIDGYAHHADRDAFERDRRRDADLAAAGLTVIRVTWRQLEDEPEAVVARVALALGARVR